MMASRAQGSPQLPIVSSSLIPRVSSTSPWHQVGMDRCMDSIVICSNSGTDRPGLIPSSCACRHDIQSLMQSRQLLTSIICTGNREARDQLKHLFAGLPNSVGFSFSALTVGLTTGMCTTTLHAADVAQPSAPGTWPPAKCMPVRPANHCI